MASTAPTPVRPMTIAVPIAAVAAVVVNVVVLFIGQAAGAALVAGGQPVGVVQVIIATLVTFALGAGLLWLVARRRPDGVRLLAWIGLGLGVVSVIAPLTMAAGLATGLTLAPMHLVAGIAWFVAVSRRG
ncbi:MAG: DUF6069 family protein [Propionicimonas sp.]